MTDPARDLGTIQRWMQAVITNPLGVTRGMQSAAARAQIPVDPVAADIVIRPSSALTSIQRLEIYGKLEPQTIKSIKGATVVQFDLVEEKTNQRLKVLYDNQSIALPATFPAASHAKVVGLYVAADQQFIGDTVLTKCPTKYEGEKDLDIARKDAVNKWQKAIGYKSEGEAAAPGRASGLGTAFPAALVR